jgi:hypothetical protein
MKKITDLTQIPLYKKKGINFIEVSTQNKKEQKDARQLYEHVLGVFS